MYTLDFERITAEKLGGVAWVLDRLEERVGPSERLLAPSRRAGGRAAALVPRRRRPRPWPARKRDVGDGEARRRAARAASGRRGRRPARPRRARRRSGRGDRGPCGGALPRLGRLDDRRRHGRGAAARDRAAGARPAVTAPLEGIRVVEYAQYVAGPLCGSLLAELGADVVKVEPPRGDAYRYVMPVAPGLGRYFVPLNRGKRSVVLDLKTDSGRERSAALLGDGGRSSCTTSGRSRRRRSGSTGRTCTRRTRGSSSAWSRRSARRDRWPALPPTTSSRRAGRGC